MKAALSQDNVAAVLGTQSKPQPEGKKTIKYAGNLNRLALHFVNKGMEAK